MPAPGYRPPALEGQPDAALILTLPREMLLNICAHSEPQDHSRFSRTCRFLTHTLQPDLFMRCVNKNKEDEEKSTYEAMAYGCAHPDKLEIIERALAYGLPATVDHVVGDGLSALATACLNGSTTAVRYLLQHGADPNKFGHASTNPGGLMHVRSPLACALRGIHVDQVYNSKIAFVQIFHDLLEAGVDVTCTLPNEMTVTGDECAVTLILDAIGLPIAARWELVEAFAERGAELNGYGAGGESPLMRAISDARYTIMNDSRDLVERLIRCGADPNYDSSRGLRCTPLGVAINRSNVEVVRQLISRGANCSNELFDAVNDTNPLLRAVMNSHPSIVLAILQEGVSPNFVPTVSRNGFFETTALRMALLLLDERLPRVLWTRDDKARILRYLLDAGADPNLRDGNRHTPLVTLLSANKVPNRAFWVETLLKVGADPNLADESGLSSRWPLAAVITSCWNNERTPMSNIRSDVERERIVEMLLRAGANPQVLNVDVGWLIKDIHGTHDFNKLKELFEHEVSRVEQRGEFVHNDEITLKDIPQDGWDNKLIPMLMEAGMAVSRVHVLLAQLDG
jgi:ankyrin repeat protein